MRLECEIEIVEDKVEMVKIVICLKGRLVRKEEI